MVPYEFRTPLDLRNMLVSGNLSILVVQAHIGWHPHGTRSYIRCGNVSVEWSVSHVLACSAVVFPEFFEPVAPFITIIA